MHTALKTIGIYSGSFRPLYAQKNKTRTYRNGCSSRRTSKIVRGVFHNTMRIILSGATKKCAGCISSVSLRRVCISSKHTQKYRELRRGIFSSYFPDDPRSRAKCFQIGRSHSRAGRLTPCLLMAVEHLQARCIVAGHHISEVPPIEGRQGPNTNPGFSGSQSSRLVSLRSSRYEKNCTAVYSIPYRNVKGVRWMPRLQKATKDVVWLR